MISYLYIQKVLTPLKKGQEQQKEFIASVSHELRAPLTVIKAGIGSVKKELSDDNFEDERILKAKRYIFPIESECIRMNRLINDMLLLSSVEQGNWSIIQETVDIETLLIEVYDTFCTLHSEDSRIINIDLSEEALKHISGDYERLKQVCMILLDNALSYTLSNSSIILRAYNRKTSICIEVEDHGEGMKEDEKERVFDAFYRRESSRNDKNHFGLGLSIAKQIIELHSGSISIKDTVGGGTTFYICLNVL
jgi:signal transduction histidine kinase